MFGFISLHEDKAPFGIDWRDLDDFQPIVAASGADDASQAAIASDAPPNQSDERQDEDQRHEKTEIG